MTSWTVGVSEFKWNEIYACDKNAIKITQLLHTHSS